MSPTKRERLLALENGEHIPTFLMPVELPKYCFLSEAIEWIAIGRVPQAEFHIDGSLEDPIEYRFYSGAMPDNFEPSYEHSWFDRLEFQSAGIPIEEEYFLAAEKTYFEFVHHLPQQIAELEAKEPSVSEDDDGNEFNVFQKMAADYREKLDELGPYQIIVDRVERQFDVLYELAWAKLFQFLHKGDVALEAVNMPRWEKLVDEGDYERAAKFVQIEGKNFVLNFDYRQNKIEIDGVSFVALRLKTADILRNRSVLLQQGKSITVERFGAFYSTKNSSHSNLRRKRGRPKSIDWDILKKHLNTLVQENRVPDGKENCIYELIAYSERTLGKSPSRSSVQRHLSSDMNRIYAQI